MRDEMTLLVTCSGYLVCLGTYYKYVTGDPTSCCSAAPAARCGSAVRVALFLARCMYCIIQTKRFGFQLACHIPTKQVASILQHHLTLEATFPDKVQKA